MSPDCVRSNEVLKRRFYFYLIGTIDQDRTFATNHYHIPPELSLSGSLKAADLPSIVRLCGYSVQSIPCSRNRTTYIPVWGCNTTVDHLHKISPLEPPSTTVSDWSPIVASYTSHSVFQVRHTIRIYTVRSFSSIFTIIQPLIDHGRLPPAVYRWCCYNEVLVCCPQTAAMRRPSQAMAEWYHSRLSLLIIVNCLPSPPRSQTFSQSSQTLHELYGRSCISVSGRHASVLSKFGQQHAQLFCHQHIHHNMR